MTTAESSSGIGLSIAPRTAIHAPVGAIARHQPSTRCESRVQRLVNEYSTTLASATGANSSVRRFSIAAATRKIAALTMVNAQANRTDREPAGIARIFVRGLRAS